MSELERYEPPSRPVLPVDSWVDVLGQVGDLASKLSDTDFVPESMRKKPAAVAAAILTGRELGVPPMTSLAHIHLVKGRPGMSAQLMRQLILSAGHELRYVETTDTRCVVRGRRRGEDEWTQVTFTADQARRAKIDLGAYPEDKLVARATSRLARRAFADVLGGLPYLPDEAAEAAADRGSDAPPAAPAPAGRRTARRAVAPRRQPEPPSATPPAPPLDHDDPPLDDDPDDDDPVDADVVEETPPPPQPATPAQLKALAAGMNACGWTDRADRLRLASAVAGRPLTSSKELTRREAGELLDALTFAQNTDDPATALTGLIQASHDDAVDGEYVDDPDPTTETP